MRPKVYITRKLPEQVVSRLEQSFDIQMWEQEDVPVPREILEKEIADIDGLYCLLTETIDKALLNKAKHLKIVSNMAVGYNNIDIEAASKRGILVTNTPGVLTETTADLTFALLMASARRIVESANFVKAGKWRTWSPMLLTGVDIYNSTLGIIGLGRIGEALAKRAKGFNMTILYHNRSRNEAAEKELGIQYTDFETLLKQSDFVCVLTPFTAETKNLISAKQFSMMKNTAILINPARGGIVNESDLYEALKNGLILGAGLDVFEQEPVSLDHPLLALDNVTALPHIGSASVNTRMKMAHLAADHLIQALNNEVPKHVVNAAALQN